MDRLLQIIDSFEGLASRGELLVNRVDADTIDVAAWYGRRILRVRKGWYARADEHPEVIRAWRVGGRITCVSAVAFRQGEPALPVLHVEVPANTARLRDPDSRRGRLTDGAAVVVHWTRTPGPGDRRAVSLEHAEQVAARCGTHGAGLPRAGAAAQAAAERASASRMV